MANILKNNAASQGTAKLYLNEKLADVHFVFNINEEIQSIPANKANLAALSPVFDAMFFGSLKESKEVKIVDASVRAFKEFLQLFYLNEVTLTMENIEAVARLADKYDVLEYVNACAEYLQSELVMDKMCWGLQFALFIKNQPLIEFCEKEINKSSKEVFATDAFRRCERETLEHILRLSLNCTTTDVFNGCIEWAKNACKHEGLDETQLENVKAQLSDSFKLIQFGEMTIQEFVRIQKSYKGLFTAEEFQDIVLQITSTEHQLKEFDLNRDFNWDNTKVLECKRLTVSNTKNNVQSIEVVSFSSNQLILLGEILSSTTYIGEILAGGSPTDITITELENDNYPFSSWKTIYESKVPSPWSNGQVKIVLSTPILIKPNTVYEIRIMKSPQCAYTYDETWEPSVKLENGLRIRFYRNPSAGYDNATTGWISTLKFNNVCLEK